MALNEEKGVVFTQRDIIKVFRHVYPEIVSGKWKRSKETGEDELVLTIRSELIAITQIEEKTVQEYPRFLITRDAVGKRLVPQIRH